MFTSYLLGYLLHWRTICWVLASQPVLLFSLTCLVRESPYWLVQKGRKVTNSMSL